MKHTLLNSFILLVLISCSTQSVHEERTPASAKEKAQDLSILFLNKSSYGENKTFIRSLIDKVIVLSNGKILAKDSQQFRQRSHRALFDYFFPKAALPAAISESAVNQFNSKLFEQISKNDSVAKLHLVLEDLSFLVTHASYNLKFENEGNVEQLLKKDQKKIIQFLNKVNKNSFADLSETEKTDFFNLLKGSELQCRRSMYFKIQALYMSSIYDSPIGEKIAGVKLPQKVRPDIDDFMKSHPLNIPQVKAAEKYDVIVVGSGPAGSVIAHEIIKKGKSVLLLEGGSFFHPGTIDSRKFSEFKESAGNRTTDDDSIIFRAGTVSGGGTSINIDLAFSPELPEVNKQIEYWRSQGHIDHDQFTPEKIQKAYQFISEKVGTRTPSFDEINTNNSILFEGAKRSGYVPQLYDLNTYSPAQRREKITDKKSSVDAFILPAMLNRKNPLHFRPDAYVEKILFAEDGKTVRGLQAKIRKALNVPGVIANPMGLNFPEEQSFEIAAEKIIICAGSMGTPKILLDSGIKNENIGRHIVAHPSMPIIGKFSQNINILDGTPSTVYVPRVGYILESTSASPGYAAVMMPGTPSEVRDRLSSFNQYAGFGVMVVDESTMKNKVYVDQNKSLQIHYELTEVDKDKFIEGIADAAQIMFRAGASEVLIPSSENFLNDSGIGIMHSLKDVELLRKNLKLVKSKNIITSAHIQGTARMGTDPSNSVVDSRQEVWGTKNLYVADSSIHPYSVGANPMQTIYTLAKIFADELYED
ncbi:MAG: GMC family oxidoreductase [Bacteriovorax sp.]|jgi:choline dehydrogenase-like flavoprotein